MNVTHNTPYIYKIKSDYTSRDHNNQIKDCKNYIGTCIIGQLLFYIMKMNLLTLGIKNDTSG